MTNDKIELIDAVADKTSATMSKIYPPEVYRQIQYFLNYRNGEQMVKRYLAILNSPGYADIYRKPRKITKKP